MGRKSLAGAGRAVQDRLPLALEGVGDLLEGRIDCRGVHQGRCVALAAVAGLLRLDLQKQ